MKCLVLLPVVVVEFVLLMSADIARRVGHLREDRGYPPSTTPTQRLIRRIPGGFLFSGRLKTEPETD